MSKYEFVVLPACLLTVGLDHVSCVRWERELCIPSPSRRDQATESIRLLDLTCLVDHDYCG